MSRAASVGAASRMTLTSRRNVSSVWPVHRSTSARLSAASIRSSTTPPRILLQASRQRRRVHQVSAKGLEHHALQGQEAPRARCSSGPARGRPMPAPPGRRDAWPGPRCSGAPSPRRCPGPRRPRPRGHVDPHARRPRRSPAVSSRMSVMHACQQDLAPWVRPRHDQLGRRPRTTQRGVALPVLRVDPCFLDHHPPVRRRIIQSRATSTPRPAAVADSAYRPTLRSAWVHTNSARTWP